MLIILTIACLAIALTGLITSIIISKEITPLKARIMNLESNHIENEKFTSLLGRDPFITAYREAKYDYNKEITKYEKDLEEWLKYDRISKLIGDKEIALNIISSFPKKYSRAMFDSDKNHKNSVLFDEIISEFEKYYEEKQEAQEDKKSDVKIHILNLIKAGYIEKFTFRSKNSSKEEILYRLTDYKSSIIKELMGTDSPRPEKPVAPSIKDFIDKEMVKEWVEQVKMELLEEELAELDY